MCGMPLWKPHALANPHPDQLELRLGDRVVSTADIQGVPVGSEGRVLLANGFNWQRYRILFANGVEVGDLDGRQLAPTGKAEKRLRKAERKAART